MGLTGSSLVLISESVFVSSAERDAERAVVWLRGEHDLSTVAALSGVLDRVIAFDDADLILDLSEVLFMDASTIGAIIRTQQFLRERSRTLSVRAPSRCARHLLHLCELTDLIESGPIEITVRSGGAAALATWVAVPAISPAEPVDASSPKRINTSTQDSVSAGPDPSRDLVA